MNKTYKKNGLLVFDIDIFSKPIEDLTSEELNFYKLFTFLVSKDVPLDKVEIKMYLANNLIEFERATKKIKDDCFDEVIEVENIYFYITGKKKNNLPIRDFYEKNENWDSEEDVFGYFEYILKKDAPTNIQLKTISNDEKINLVKNNNYFNYCWDDSFNFTRAIRNSYKKLFTYEELIAILKSFDELWNYIKEDIKELKDLKSLRKYLESNSYAGDCNFTIHNSDGTCEVFNRHAQIEIYSKKKRTNEKNFSNLKKAYEKDDIYLELDNENIVGFKVKDLTNIITNEKIEDAFSIDFFRYDAPENLLETSNISLVKSIYSSDEIIQMIYESINVCFEEIRNSIFEKIK